MSFSKIQAMSPACERRLRQKQRIRERNRRLHVHAELLLSLLKHRVIKANGKRKPPEWLASVAKLIDHIENGN